jgi:hypothetical protein
VKATELNGKNGGQHWEEPAAAGGKEGREGAADGTHEAASTKPAAPQEAVPEGDEALAAAAKKATSNGGGGGSGAQEVSAFSYTGAPHPTNEKERREALCACNILDTAPDPRFDDITKLVRAHHAEAPAPCVFRWPTGFLKGQHAPAPASAPTSHLLCLVACPGSLLHADPLKLTDSASPVICPLPDHTAPCSWVPLPRWRIREGAAQAWHGAVPRPYSAGPLRSAEHVPAPPVALVRCAALQHLPRAHRDREPGGPGPPVVQEHPGPAGARDGPLQQLLRLDAAAQEPRGPHRQRCHQGRPVRRADGGCMRVHMLLHAEDAAPGCACLWQEEMLR